MRDMKHSRPGDPCKTICRPSQPHPNPAPGASPEAAAAAKNDVKKRTESSSVIDTLLKKLMPGPPVASENKSAAALADRKDQEKKLGSDVR